MKNPVDNVVFVVITDGHENASKEFNQKQEFDMITKCKDNDGWEFVFLGVNRDAIQSGGMIGVKAANSATFNSANIGIGYSTLSKKINTYRETGISGSLDWTLQERSALIDNS